MSHLSSHVRANNHLLFADAAESLLQADKFSKKKEEFNDSYDTSNILQIFIMNKQSIKDIKNPI